MSLRSTDLPTSYGAPGPPPQTLPALPLSEPLELEANFGATDQKDEKTDIEGGEEKFLEALPEYPQGIRLVLIMLAMFITEFAVGLDQTIVASAIPKISNDFNALNQVGWYGSAYLLCSCSLQPLFGRAYMYFSQKRVFVFALVLFEGGSLLSALAHSSPVFIVGRALQGAGYAGLFIGVLSIGSASLPVALQPIYTSIIGAAYGLGACLGPLIGGAVTSKLSWRWAFWINLPPGGITVLIVIFFCHPPPIPQTMPVLSRIKRMDWLGAVLLLSSSTCLLLALQDGGIARPWHSANIIGLLVGFATILITFIALQVYLREEASINIRLLLQRNVAAIGLLNFTVGATYYSLLYFVPIFFQAIQGSSPIRSGVQTLAMIVPVVVGNVGTGWLVSRFLTFHWEMLFGGICIAVGSGLLATMTAETSVARWAGYQVIVGAGMGGIYMMGYIATQATLPRQDRASGASIVVFLQLYGATVWVSASEAIYQNQLLDGIEKIPGLDVASVVDSGVSKFREVVPAAILPAVVQAAVASLKDVFIAIAAVAVIGFAATFFINWTKIEAQVIEKSDQSG